ncbi:hypothetical protein D037_1985B, partial [Vibrio parahaemolyticus IDH02640]
SVVSKIQ